MAGGKTIDHLAPEIGVAEPAVGEHHRRAAAAVEHPDLPGLDPDHAWRAQQGRAVKMSGDSVVGSHGILHYKIHTVCILRRPGRCQESFDAAICLISMTKPDGPARKKARKTQGERSAATTALLI